MPVWGQLDAHLSAAMGCPHPNLCMQGSGLLAVLCRCPRLEVGASSTAMLLMEDDLGGRLWRDLGLFCVSLGCQWGCCLLGKTFAGPSPCTSERASVGCPQDALCCFVTKTSVPVFFFCRFNTNCLPAMTLRVLYRS